MSLYDRVGTKKNPVFKTNEEALRFFTKQYEALGQKYGQTGDQLWMKVEEDGWGEAPDDSEIIKEDSKKIQRLCRNIAMCKHLIKSYGK